MSDEKTEEEVAAAYEKLKPELAKLSGLVEGEALKAAKALSRTEDFSTAFESVLKDSDWRAFVEKYGDKIVKGEFDELLKDGEEKTETPEE